MHIGKTRPTIKEQLKHMITSTEILAKINTFKSVNVNKTFSNIEIKLETLFKKFENIKENNYGEFNFPLSFCDVWFDNREHEIGIIEYLDKKNKELLEYGWVILRPKADYFQQYPFGAKLFLEVVPKKNKNE